MMDAKDAVRIVFETTGETAVHVLEGEDFFLVDTNKRVVLGGFCYYVSKNDYSIWEYIPRVNLSILESAKPVAEKLWRGSNC